MNCTQANSALSDYDVPPNLQPYVDVLLNETAEDHSNTAPATCPKDQREQKNRHGGNNGTNLRPLA